MTLKKFVHFNKVVECICIVINNVLILLISIRSEVMPSLSFQIIIHVCFFFLGQFSQPTPRAGSPVPVPHQGPLPNPPLAAGRRLSTTPQSNQSASLGPLWWGTPRRPSQKEKGKLASAQGLAEGRRLSHALSSSCQWLGQMSHTVLNLVA